MNNWLGSRNVAAIKLQERHDHFSDCAITRHTHSLRSCHLPSIMTLFQYVSLASFSPYLSFFFLFLKPTYLRVEGTFTSHLTSLSSRVYTFILIERLQISCRPHDTWSSKLFFLEGANHRYGFVQIRDVFQPTCPLLFTTVLTFREKGRSVCHANSFFAFLLKVWVWDM